MKTPQMNDYVQWPCTSVRTNWNTPLFHICINKLQQQIHTLKKRSINVRKRSYTKTTTKACVSIPFLEVPLQYFTSYESSSAYFFLMQKKRFSRLIYANQIVISTENKWATQTAWFCCFIGGGVIVFVASAVACLVKIITLSYHHRVMCLRCDSLSATILFITLLCEMGRIREKKT